MQQLVELKRLGDEVRRAALDRIDGVLHRAVAGDDDGDDARDSGRRAASMTAGPVDAGQPQVGDDDVEGELLEQLERLFAAVGLDDFEAALGQPLGHERAQGRLVIDKEKMQHGANILTHRPRTGRRRRARTLDPALSTRYGY